MISDVGHSLLNSIIMITMNFKSCFDSLQLTDKAPSIMGVGYT